MKPAEFARKCGIRESLLRKYLAGSMPGADKAAQIASRNGVTLDWLVTGEGDAAAGTSAKDPGRAYSPAALDEDFMMVPRYDIAGSAGGGALIHSEQIVDHLAFRADWVRNALGVSRRDLALISVKGDSMEPTLSSGDLILVDTSVRALGDSAVYVLRKGDELFVKRIQHKLDGTVIVKSDNERYEPEIFDAEHAPAVQVVGRVLWVGRRL